MARMFTSSAKPARSFRSLIAALVAVLFSFDSSFTSAPHLGFTLVQDPAPASSGSLAHPRE
jgi:hypothetical protein